jgi:hypothetical protein
MIEENNLENMNRLINKKKENEKKNDTEKKDSSIDKENENIENIVGNYTYLYIYI